MDSTSFSGFVTASPKGVGTFWNHDARHLDHHQHHSLVTIVNFKVASLIIAIIIITITITFLHVAENPVPVTDRSLWNLTDILLVRLITWP